MTWFDDGQAFLWQSDEDGYRHFYRVTRDGKEKTLITKGGYDVIQMLKFDTDNGWLYFIASRGRCNSALPVSRTHRRHG